MQRLDSAAATLVQRLPGFLLLLLLLAGGWRLAGWGWRFVPAPPVEARLMATADGAQGIAARHWFGKAPIEAPARPGGTDEAKAAPTIADDIKLLGVIAGGKRSAAMLLVGKTAYDAVVGEEFANGLRLKSVSSDAVVIVRNGRDERVVLPTSPPATAPGVNPSTPAGAPNASSGANGGSRPNASPTPGVTPLTAPASPPSAKLSGAMNPPPDKTSAKINPLSTRAPRP